jgi:hypothetical protein
MICLWQPSLRAAPCWKKAVALTDVVSIELPKPTPNFVAMDRLLNGRQEKMKPVDVNRWLGSRQAGWRWELACMKNALNSKNMAEGRGFEPRRGVNPNTLSRRAP